ncbi:thioesterase II family protein [Paenibacillus sp. 481]|uniref:thioesterase II family protein n=1 Tax=Paenibacillus sp. 481 TaxID=2835869 RepID=UPI001E659E7F|nr:alpha/beta fold hydrolase [Paenibacillus sp. 481]UHA73855.1 thioesterase [Paenibacillus sp. 481]
MNKVRWLCLPYAGASASVYMRWKRHLPANVELVPLELAARGTRFGESPYGSVEEAVLDIDRIIKPWLEDEVPCLLFGHSMGAVLAFEWLVSAFAAGTRVPDTVILSGRPAPQYIEAEDPICNLPDDQFIIKVAEYGAVEAEVLQQEEIKQMFLPILRADFTILDDFDSRPVRSAVQLPISAHVWHGSNEDMKGGPDGWSAWFTQPAQIREFAGGHFFIHEEEQAVISALLECEPFKGRPYEVSL